VNAHVKIPQGIVYHPDLIQGSEEWHQMRCGLLTASEIKLILTPTLKIAANVKERAHLWELAAQRISQYVEPTYIGDDMLRGQHDEIVARELYHQNIAPVVECGFITNDKWGFTLGCSPDGLVGDDGLIEVKSRRQKFQIQTIVEHYESGAIPEDYVLQVQAELLVTGRKWCDLISFSGGLPMATMRVFPDPKIHDAIIDAASKFEARISETVADYFAAVASDPTMIPTERREEEEIII
jgi:predicted phage-related endonuclease